MKAVKNIVRKVRSHPKWLPIVFLAILLSGCAGTSSVSSTGAKADSSGKSARQPAAAIQTNAHAPDSVEQQLRHKVRQWLGTPHRLGGTSRKGIDCSGFAQMIYRDVFNKKIPRSTALQVKSGYSADRNKLLAGDLVFFRIPGKKRHVGIYLGQAEFAHASSSKGVIISSLEEQYWRDSYWTARRYMDR